MRRALSLLRAEEGSTLPLILGYLLLAIAVTLVCVCATDLYIAQKRLDSLADSAALAGADGFVLSVGADGARAELTDGGVREQALAIVTAIDSDAEVLAATTPDGVSARVSVRAVWNPPVLSPFIPGGVELISTATSRTALR